MIVWSAFLLPKDCFGQAAADLRLDRVTAGNLKQHRQFSLANHIEPGFSPCEQVRGIGFE